jgi:hypothetical protein
MVGRYRVEVSFLGPSGIPKDQFENVWHWSGAGTDKPSEAISAMAMTASFYMNETGSATVASFLSPQIHRTATLTVYDEDAAKPRPILAHDTIVMADPPNNNGLPEEIAVALSYYSERNLPRQRGRLYIGPLHVNAMEQDVDPRPSTGLIVAMTGNAAFITGNRAPTSAEYRYLQHSAAPAGAPPVTWCVRSGTGGPIRTPGVANYQAITNGWVDNEWDGQSRRRLAASARVVWPSS